MTPNESFPFEDMYTDSKQFKMKSQNINATFKHYFLRYLHFSQFPPQWHSRFPPIPVDR